MQTRVTIKPGNLKPGMYVVLPQSWFKHPFLTNEFVIKSQDQIDKIIAFGIREIVIDTTKGLSLSEAEAAVRSAMLPLPAQAKTWEPEKLVPPALREAIHDKTLAPEKKSRAVYEASRVLVERLLEDPKAENIQEAKKGIAEITDLILVDSKTARQMLTITKYDYYTYTHSVNVGFFSLMLAKELFKGSDAHDMHEMGAGFFLHDIGKVHVNPAVINKPGKVSHDEMIEIRSHPNHGYKLLEETRQLSKECMYIVMQHHEREDGTGYPRRLKGNDIHTYGRICCIADVYDALTAERSYKKPLSTFDALKLMKGELLNHFQKEMFEKFVLLFTR